MFRQITNNQFYMTKTHLRSKISSIRWASLIVVVVVVFAVVVVVYLLRFLQQQHRQPQQQQRKRRAAQRNEMTTQLPGTQRPVP